MDLLRAIFLAMGTTRNTPSRRRSSYRNYHEYHSFHSSMYKQSRVNCCSGNDESCWLCQHLKMYLVVQHVRTSLN